MFKKSVLIMRGKQNKWRAQQRSQVAERTGDSVGADVTSVSRDQTLTTFIATLASSWNSHHAPGLTEIFIPICVYLTAVFFFFFNHAAVDVLAFLSFFLVEFLSVLLFSFGFGHFWHIWWACSRPDSVPSLNMQRLRHTILYKILHRLSSLSFNLIYPWGQYVISMHLYNAIGLSHYDLRSKGSETSYFVHFCVYKICAFI